MANVLTIDDFLVDLTAFQPKPKIPVCIPRRPFRIEKESVRHGYLLCSENQWYLVHPEVALTPGMKGIYKASLYKGLLDDDTLFLLPVTHPDAGKSNSWTEAWLEIVAVAEKRWLKASKCEEENRYKGKAIKSSLEPEWPELDSETCIELAFQNKLITRTDHPVLLAVNKKAKSTVTFDEEFEE